jgi:hypothetical protein
MIEPGRVGVTLAIPQNDTVGLISPEQKTLHFSWEGYQVQGLDTARSGKIPDMI